MVSYFRNIGQSTNLELNITSKPEFWTWLLTSTNLNEKQNLNVSIDKSWFYSEFSDFLSLLNFDLNGNNLVFLQPATYKDIDWSFLRSNRYKNAEVFKDQYILLTNPIFLCQHQKILLPEINTAQSQIAQLIYDYYRRYIPFLYSFLKLVRVQQKLSLEIKLPAMDMFFSNFGDIKTGEFIKGPLPFDDDKLLSIIRDNFIEYCVLRRENKFGRAIKQLNDVIRGLAEYLKIITTVNYIDYDLMHFLHECFMGDKFEFYSNLFKAGDEEFLLDNLSWTYTKAFQFSGI